MQNGNKAKDTFSFRVQNFRKKQSVFRLKPRQEFFSAAICYEGSLNRQPKKPSDNKGRVLKLCLCSGWTITHVSNPNVAKEPLKV
jgi:hypothetical protein